MEKNLLLLFERPSEPIYVPKGEHDVNFDIPTEYMQEEYQHLSLGILTRFDGESKSKVRIKKIAIPDLTIPLSIDQFENFSHLIPQHCEAASHLINLFLGMRSIEDLLSLAAYCRDRVNPQMFIYSLSVAMLHRPDTKQLDIPKLCEVFPDKFMGSTVFSRAKRQANIVPAGSRASIEIPKDYTATDAVLEHRLSYWREDVGLNSHHWHWHLIYPFMGPSIVINKNRRGELFYYHHHQIMARYNIERFCNGLSRVRPLTNFREPIPEAYFPKMDQTVAGRAWPARPVNMVISDIDRPSINMKFSVKDIERSRDRVIEAILTKKVRTPEGNTITLDEVTGIDILGNLVEATDLSLNKDWYGNLHNYGHLSLGFIHDPDNRYLEPIATIGDVATSMRDPIFYRWHQFVDEIFALYKDSLPFYKIEQLDFPGVKISDVQITRSGANTNTINTHWTKSEVELSRGLDFAPKGSITARFQHLNYEQFFYNIFVNNSNEFNVIGTVRIFMAPRFDPQGHTLTVNEQRMLMIEMDKFTVTLNSGPNLVKRSSNESAVTIPFEATFRQLNPDLAAEELQVSNLNNYCGCGWPQHLLIPKGNVEGYKMDLFVMISDYVQDRVDQAEPTGCQTGISFCGLKDLKYPDARAMGYPFDRAIRTNSMRGFLTPNMKMQKINIRFSDSIKPRQ